MSDATPVPEANPEHGGSYIRNLDGTLTRVEGPQLTNELPNELPDALPGDTTNPQASKEVI
jgi:hypothetical protein